MLSGFYSVMGSAPDAPGSLAAMARILCEEALDEQIDAALHRCMRECRYPVRIPDILHRLPGKGPEAEDAEARRGWDVLMDFVDKYVGNNSFGVYGPEHGSCGEFCRRGQRVAASFPVLSQRLLDTVRRTGGWRTYKCMTEADFPFQQKRFLEEYRCWSAVNSLPSERFALPSEVQKQLVGARGPAPNRDAVAMKPAQIIKRIPEPLTAAQLADRREMLKQQAATMLERRRRVG